MKLNIYYDKYVVSLKTIDKIIKEIQDKIDTFEFNDKNIYKDVYYTDDFFDYSIKIKKNKKSYRVEIDVYNEFNYGISWAGKKDRKIMNRILMYPFPTVWVYSDMHGSKMIHKEIMINDYSNFISSLYLYMRERKYELADINYRELLDKICSQTYWGRREYEQITDDNIPKSWYEQSIKEYIANLDESIINDFFETCFTKRDEYNARY